MFIWQGVQTASTNNQIVDITIVRGTWDLVRQWPVFNGKS